MVVVKTHGGSCCGARHLYGFGPDENRDTSRILTAQRQVPNTRMTEVILNGRQVEGYPNVLNRLATLGYVLVGHYVNGNHMSDNYVFHRCDRRRPLLNEDGSCVIPGWTGAVITPRMRGELPGIFDGPTTTGIRPARPEQIREDLIRPEVFNDTNIRIGDRVRINSPRSRYHGQQATVERLYHNWNRRAVTLSNGATISVNNVELLNAPHQTIPVIGKRVVWNATDPLGLRSSGIRRNVYQRGLLGTIQVVDLINDRFYIKWDNLPANHNATTYINRNQFTVLTDEEAAANPRREYPPEPEAEVNHRHEEPEDWAPIMALLTGEQPEEPRAPTVLHSTYHCVSRDGTRGAGFDEFGDAQDNLGRRTRIDRRDIMSDGTIRWEENIEI